MNVMIIQSSFYSGHKSVVELRKYTKPSDRFYAHPNLNWRISLTFLITPRTQLCLYSVLKSLCQDSRDFTEFHFKKNLTNKVNKRHHNEFGKQQWYLQSYDPGSQIHIYVTGTLHYRSPQDSVEECLC